jgi:FlaA1/EpsC-like NDP-sugar epimerase
MKLITNRRALLALFFDALISFGAWLFLIFARLGFESRDLSPDKHNVLVALVVTAITVVATVSFGLYRGFWRFASHHDIAHIAKAIGVASLLTPLFHILTTLNVGVPRSIYLLHPVLVFFGMVSSRVIYRWWKDHQSYGSFRRQGEPLLLLGASDHAMAIVEELSRTPAWNVVGILDDSSEKVGRSILGVPVRGTWGDLGLISSQLGVRNVVLVDKSLHHTVRRKIFDLCESANVKLLVLPSVDDLISGKVQVSQVRKVELDDLLGRDSVELDNTGLQKLIGNKTVLVTGAGGSIGSELCKQIARFGPKKLVMFDHDEFASFEISEHFKDWLPRIAIQVIIGDVKDDVRLENVFAEVAPEIVFHAAAYKHVPLMENDNCAQAVRNNVLGTLNIANVCIRHSVEKLVFISTDKAVNPTNVMGATKRFAEMVLQALHARTGLSAIMVRFGNVLGSNGSVIPKFREQIARGGPITITDPEMQRYFMSIPEAAQLVLQAGLMGAGGEVFILDMGDPVKIVDLARDMIRLSGLDENEIKIKFTGLRPGEKLFEELLANNETTLSTSHSKLRVQRATSVPGPSWEKAAVGWLSNVESYSDEAIRNGLKAIVPEYKIPTKGAGATQSPVKRANLKA